MTKLLFKNIEISGLPSTWHKEFNGVSHRVDTKHDQILNGNTYLTFTMGTIID